MFNQLSAKQIANNIENQVIKHEIVETNILLPDEHKIEFKLVVLSQVYKVEILAKFADEPTVTKIYTDLWSSFLSDYNIGLVAKAT